MIDWQEAYPRLLRRVGLVNERPSVPKVRIGLIMHCFYTEGLLRFLKSLPIGLNFDLFITTNTGDKKLEILSILETHLSEELRLACLEVVPNHGRDVLAFWELMTNYSRYSDTDYFLKIHIKKSDYLAREVASEIFDADMWAYHMLNCLLPSCQQTLDELVQVLRDNLIGVLYPEPPPFLSSYGWGRECSYDLALKICDENSINSCLLLLPLMFPAGNFFIGNVRLFSEYSHYFSNPNLYPNEPLENDGTFLHAAERVYSSLVLSKDMNIGYSLHPSSKTNAHPVDFEQREDSLMRIAIPEMAPLAPGGMINVAMLHKLQLQALAKASAKSLDYYKSRTEMQTRILFSLLIRRLLKKLFKGV